MNSVEAKGLRDLLLGGVERERPTTQKVLEAVPDHQLDFKLGDKGRTARELAWHLASSEVWFADGVASADFSKPEKPMPPHATTADIVSYYEKEMLTHIARLQALSGEDLAKNVSFFGMMNNPNVSYLMFLINHSVHHRGQLSAYLRAMNAHVPSIYGGSADEPFQMPAKA